MVGGKILVYDLVSENHRALRNTPLFGKVRAVRIKCTSMLYKLGIPCTESVILINSSHAERISETIEMVRELYEDVLHEVNNALGVRLPEPVIKVLDITQDQYQVFRDLAERRLRESIDGQIDRVSMIIETVADQSDQNKRRSIIHSLKKLKREWMRIKEACMGIGINLEDEINYLLDLIDQAINALYS